MERSRAGRFPAAAVSKWNSATKSLFVPQLEELLPVKDYWDVLQDLPKEGTAMSPEQWNWTRQLTLQSQHLPVRSGPGQSLSLHFPCHRMNSSPTSSQPTPSVYEAVVSSNLGLEEVQSDSEAEKVAAN